MVVMATEAARHEGSQVIPACAVAVPQARDPDLGNVKLFY